MFRIGFHDITGPDGTGDFLDVAVAMDDSDNVERATWEYAGDAASNGVLHWRGFKSLFWLFCFLIKRKREKGYGVFVGEIKDMYGKWK